MAFLFMTGLETTIHFWRRHPGMILPFVSMLVWKWAYYAPNTYKEPTGTNSEPSGFQERHISSCLISCLIYAVYSKSWTWESQPFWVDLYWRLKELKLTEMRNKMIPLPKDFDPQKPLTLGNLAAGQGKGVLSLWELFTKVMGPYFIFRFFLLPLPLIFFGSAFYFNGVPWDQNWWLVFWVPWCQTAGWKTTLSS